MSESVIQIDAQTEIEKIIRQLDTLPNQMKAPSVLAAAINAAANEMKRKIGQKTRKRYAISDKKILTDKKRGGMYLERAKGADTSATLISRGEMVEVMAYMTRRNTETTAAMLKVLNESAMTALEMDGRKAFVATFESGHTAIVQREPGKQYTRGREKRASKYGEHADMTKLKKLMAPAVPMLYGKTYEEATQDYYSILQKHIQREVERVLDGFGRAA